ncbi:hypothetical protein [uncultured Gemella sp.]|jgi:hypothetical protein|uniref:hypothetical protein n=1 Tax=uncultured Gemella sp. TaxID=254352 RepID=UPI00206AD2BF|nr:hypothetical protein [uncultured Gemella sp.]DAT02938.1 MAG TPA: hypothetical protein [Caudoviricetes sp.]
MTNEELEQENNDFRFRIFEKIEDKKPYETEMYRDYLYINHLGKTYFLDAYSEKGAEEIYKRGLVFKTEEEAEHYDKERQLIQKMKDWAIEHREGLKGRYFPRWYIKYDYQDECFVYMFLAYEQFSILPCFISRDLAEQFIEEFGDEIKEVLC